MILEKGQSNLKDWIKEVGMSGRMQSAIVAALRGADADDSPEVKRLVRWIRKQTVKETNPKSHFMKDIEFMDIKALIAQDSWMWDRLKTHFYDHVKQALAVIAYYHPDEMIAARALKAYNDLQEHESLIPESKAELITRLKDTSPIARGEWVLQDWVFDLTGRMQGVLYCAMRGSDIATDDEVRRLSRWLRWVVMKNVHPTSHYMEDRDFKPIADLNKEKPWAWGNLPIHFRHHLREALEVVGYLHPDEAIRARAIQAYEDICKKSKGKPESKEILVNRLQDQPGRTYETTPQRTNLPVG